MAIDELVSQDPTTEAPPVEDNAADYADGADAPAELASDEAQETDAFGNRAEKRIKGLLSDKKAMASELEQLKQEMARQQGQLEAMQKNGGTPTVHDLSIDELRQALRSDEYEEHHDQIREILEEKLIDEKLNKRINDKQTEESIQRERSDAFTLMHSVLGEEINNPASNVYTGVVDKLAAVQRTFNDQESLQQVVAALLYRVDQLQPKTEALQQQNRNLNRNQRIEGNGRSAGGTGDSLGAILEKSGGRLSVSTQGNRDGSLRDVVKRLNVMKTFDSGG